MTIKLTNHIDLPPVYICPTCLKPTRFQAGERWQVCEEHHFAEVRGLTFATARPVNLWFPLRSRSRWAEPETPFGIVLEYPQQCLHGLEGLGFTTIHSH